MRVDFTERTVIVTGASGGIGSAACRALAARGANLVLVDRSTEALESLRGELVPEAGETKILPLVLDVTSEEQMRCMAERTLERFSRIDALVHAAGILRTSEQPTPLAETSFDEWRTVIDVNLTGTFLSNRAVLPAMISQAEGDIVNISSVSGRQGRAFDGPYSASKFGIVGLSESLAEEVQRRGVRVQTVMPGAVDTPLWEQTGTAAVRPRELLAPERVAEFIVYLLALPRDVYLLNSVINPLRSRVVRRGTDSARA